MKRFAEDTKEYAKEKYWWEDIPINRESTTVAIPATSKQQAVKETELPKVKDKRKNSKERRKKHKHESHHRKKRLRSGSSSNDSDNEKKKNDKTMERLRAERLERERREQIRVRELLAPKKEPPVAKKEPSIDFDRSRKYNSQFNPEFARQQR